MGWCGFAVTVALGLFPAWALACEPEAESCAIKCEPATNGSGEQNCRWVPGVMQCEGTECHWVYFPEGRAIPVGSGSAKGSANGSPAEVGGEAEKSTAPTEPLVGQSEHALAANALDRDGSSRAAAVSFLEIADGLTTEDKAESAKKIELGLKGLDAAKELWVMAHKKDERIRLKPDEELLNSPSGRKILGRWSSKFGASPAVLLAKLSPADTTALRADFLPDFDPNLRGDKALPGFELNLAMKSVPATGKRKYGIRDELKRALASESTDYVPGESSLDSSSASRRLEGLKAEADEFFGSRDTDEGLAEITLFEVVRRKHLELRHRLRYLRR